MLVKTVERSVNCKCSQHLYRFPSDRKVKNFLIKAVMAFNHVLHNLSNIVNHLRKIFLRNIQFACIRKLLPSDVWFRV